MTDGIDYSTEDFERALSELDGQTYLLRLFVTGNTPRSTQAIANIRDICETYLKGRYQLEVVDIYQQPELARKEQIIAAPTLIKQLPRPLRRIIGNLSQKERVLIGLDLIQVDKSINKPAQNNAA